MIIIIDIIITISTTTITGEILLLIKIILDHLILSIE
jgi:hypothetical protein